jgi:dihydroflavonol-4-reductase
VTAFVSGGSGFVGGALVARLVADGVHVVALARTSEAADRLARAGATPVPGDVFSAGVLRDAMAGCSVAYHVAGINEICPRDAAPMYRVNVDGTRIVTAAAAAAGVPRVVVTSSAAAIGEADGVVADETTPHSGRFLSHYARSKKLGEDAAFTEGARRGVEVVAVNPSSVQGPGRTEGSARLFLYAVRSRHPLLVNTTLSLVDIADCTEAHLLAAERGRPGERYLVSGASPTTSELVAMIHRAAAGGGRPIYIPRWAVASFGMWTAAGAAVALRRRPVCPELIRTLLHGHRFDGGRAVRQLGLRYTPLQETVAATIDWYRRHGLLPTAAGS